MSGPYEELFRGQLAARTPDGERATLIVTTRLGHPMGRVWVTFGATFRATLALSNPEVDELVVLLHQAKGARL